MQENDAYFTAFSASCERGIEFVTTNSSIDESLILSIAGQSKMKVMALTFDAPASFKACAALHKVPAVSIMSSGTMQVFPSTSVYLLLIH